MRLSPKGSFIWNESEKQAINYVMREFSNSSTLTYSQLNYTNYQSVVDSSNYVVSATLHQIVEENPIPVRFFSKKLTQAQTKYFTFDWQLLAIYLSMLHFLNLTKYLF